MKTVGKVGTGFKDSLLVEITERLRLVEVPSKRKYSTIVLSDGICKPFRDVY